MSPVLQVILGILIGTGFILGSIKISRHFDSFIVGISLILGTTLTSMLIAWFFFGPINLYFSTNVVKNILIVIMYEEVIWIASAFIASCLTPFGSISTDDKEFVITCIAIVLVVSAVIGAKCFYPAILNTIA